MLKRKINKNDKNNRSYDKLLKVDTKNMSDDELKKHEIKLFDAFIKQFSLRF
jgi:hypothetical protein